MRGIVKIVVKDKNGNVKVNSTLKNLIFPTYKHYLAAYMDDLADFNPSSSLARNEEYCYDGITLHDDFISTSEGGDLDFKIPVLIGGSSDNDENNQVYRKVNIHEVTDTEEYDYEQDAMIKTHSISNNWVWRSPHSFTLKSIALRDDRFTNGDTSLRTGIEFCPGFAVNYSGRDSSYEEEYRLLKDKRLSALNLGYSYHSSKDEFLDYPRYIYPLYNNEFLVFSSSSQTLDFSGFDHAFIFDNANAEEISVQNAKRHFDVSSELNTPTSSDIPKTVVPTPESDYILALDYSNYVLNINTIPRNSESSVALDPITLEKDYYNYNFVVMGRLLLISSVGYRYNGVSSTEEGIYIQFNSDGSVKTLEGYFYRRGLNVGMKSGITAYLYPMINGVTKYGYCPRYYDYHGNIYAQLPIHLNQTVRNLEEPVEIEEGDEVSVTYTISLTAGNSTL